MTSRIARATKMEEEEKKIKIASTASRLWATNSQIGDHGTINDTVSA